MRWSERRRSPPLAQLNVPWTEITVRERVDDDERAEALAAVQVFRVELIAAGSDCCLYTHRMARGVSALIGEGRA